MTVEELRALLEDLPDDAVVLTGRDEDARQAFVVTGAVAPVRLQTRGDARTWWRDRTADALGHAASGAEERFGDLPLGVVLLTD